MEQLFDLPAHPLLVHAPVMLVPLLTLGIIALAARPAWRRGLGPWPFLVSVITAISFMLAFQSGEAFDEALRRNPAFEADISHHQSLAETTRLFLLGILVVVAVAFVLDRRSAKSASADERPSVVLTWAGAVLGVLATIWIIRTGHEGARLVWEGSIK